MSRARTHVLALLFPLAMLSAPALPAQGVVHVVDQANGPGTDFTNLSGATAASASGDIILVRAGDYNESLVIDGKSLTVVADTGALVEVWEIGVRNLAATHVVAMRGLTTTGPGFISLLVEDCLGRVWLEDCDFQSILTAHFSSGGVFVRDSPSVVFARCQFEAAVILPGDGLTALDVQDSRTHMFECQVFGAPPLESSGQAISPAIRVVGGQLTLSGTEVIGGQGTDGNIFFCEGSNGGDGIFLTGTNPQVVMLDSPVSGGAAGIPAFGCPPPDPQPGQALIVNAGSASAALGNARTHSISTPVREGGTAVVSVGGLPNEFAWLLYSIAPGPGFSAGAFDGAFLLDGSPANIFLGLLPASGTVTPNITLGQLPPGIDSATLYLQTMHRDVALGRFVFGTPSLLVLLDDSL